MGFKIPEIPKFGDYEKILASADRQDDLMLVHAVLGEMVGIQQKLLDTERKSLRFISDKIARVNGMMQTINEALGKLATKADGDKEIIVNGSKDVAAFVQNLKAEGVDPAMYEVFGFEPNEYLKMTKANATKVNSNLQIRVDQAGTEAQMDQLDIQNEIKRFQTNMELDSTSIRKLREIIERIMTNTKSSQ